MKDSLTRSHDIARYLASCLKISGYWDEDSDLAAQVRTLTTTLINRLDEARTAEAIKEWS